MKCAIVCCPWNATDKGFCASHSYWVRVVMADDRYRSEPVPPCPLGCKRALLSGEAL